MTDMKLLIISLLLLPAGYAKALPVEAHKGGKPNMYICKPPGCAANVTYVYVNDEHLFSGSVTTDCEGPPAINSICRYQGQAIFSTDRDGNCDFEGNGFRIQSEKVPDNHPIYASNPATKLSSSAIVALVAGVIIVLLIVITAIGVCINKKKKHTQTPSDPGVTVPLRGMNGNP